MSDDLRDDLMEIAGVGEATADEILAVLDDHDEAASDAYLEKAMAAAENRDDREAAVYLRRAGGE